MYRYIMQQLYQSRKIYNNRKVPCRNNSVIVVLCTGTADLLVVDCWDVKMLVVS